MIQFDTEMIQPDLRLPQDYISRYISHEIQLRGSHHLHDLITAHNQAWLEDPVNDALDLPDLVSEDSTDDL